MPKRTAKKRAELAKTAKLPDSKIDLSDIPEIRGLPSDAVIGKFCRPQRRGITIRLDADVLTWLKGSDEGYQTRINTFLRQLMKRTKTSDAPDTPQFQSISIVDKANEYQS